MWCIDDRYIESFLLPAKALEDLIHVKSCIALGDRGWRNGDSSCSSDDSGMQDLLPCNDDSGIDVRRGASKGVSI